MQKFAFIGCIGLVALLSVPAQAIPEDVQICARYKAGYGWSKGYSLNATKLSGNDIYSATRDSKYLGYDTYLMINWEVSGGVSLLKLDSSYLGYLGTKAEDQRGRVWEVKERMSSLIYLDDCW